MKNKLALIAAVAAMAFTQTTQAVPITGVIGFSGTATTDGSTAATSTEVKSWGNNAIGLTSGTFDSLTPAATVAFTSATWTFASAALPSFWTVTDGGNTYTFNLTSSKVFSIGSTGGVTSISIALVGTVVSSVMGLDPTAFTGSLTLQDPSVAGQTGYKYTESLSFNAVPDGGTTVLLLGSALSGLALIRRKLSA